MSLIKPHLENKSFMSNNFARLPKVHTGALGITRGAGANWKAPGAGSRYWGTSGDLDNLKDINRAYLQTRLTNSPGPFSKQPVDSVDGQPSNKENGATFDQNPSDFDSIKAADAFKDAIGGESRNCDDTEQQTAAALEEPFSIGCRRYHGTSFHSAVARSTRKFSKPATPDTHGVGRQSGDDLMMLGALQGTAAFDEDTTLGISPPEPYATPVEMEETRWVAPKDIDFEKRRNAMEEWRRKVAESQSGWDTEWTGLLG